MSIALFLRSVILQSADRIASMGVVAHHNGGEGAGLREIEVLAGVAPAGEAGAALQGLGLREVGQTLALVSVIVRLQRLRLWQTGACIALHGSAQMYHKLR